MVIWCCVSLVDLKIWKFEAFRLIVTSAQVFHVFWDGWVSFWAKCPLHNPTAWIHDLHFSFPISRFFFEFLIQFVILDVNIIINVWLLTKASGSGKCHVFINWHFLTESTVSCKELWRNRYFENLSFSQKWPFKDLNYWLNWKAHSDYFPSGSRFLNLHQLHSLPPFSSVWTWFDFLNYNRLWFLF